MDNPYESPTPLSKFADQPYSPTGAPSGVVRGMVGHVRVVAILMIVQGALQLLMGLVLAGTGVFMGVMIGNDPQFRQGQAGGQPPPEWLPWLFGAVYGGIGLVALVSGILLIYGGIRGFSFRSRTLGIIAQISSLSSIFTCYCAPTAVGLLVYGLIVYLDSSVKQAFAMGEQGTSADQIDASFNPYTQSQVPPPKT